MKANRSLLNPLLRLVAVLTTSLIACDAEITLEDGLVSKLGTLTKDKLPGIAVLISRDGRIVYQGGFGLADTGKGSPVTAETKFRIGSVTKQFTAAAILRLVEDGKLALTDPLAKFFPDFPGGGEVTVHHLLTHTSGVHSYTDKPEFMARVTKPVAPGALIAFFRDDPPDFAPGKGFHYNNSAYFLAGEIAAKVSGESFATYLQKAFFVPLGMKDTGIYMNASPPPGAAAGYTVVEGKTSVAIEWDMSWAGGAGALYSTVGDLFRWNEALFGGKVLKASSLKLMTTPVKLPEGVDGMNYGYGLLVSELSRLPAIGHGGGLNGWSSDLLRLPEQNCTVVALANAMPTAPGFEPSAVTRRIAEKFLEEDIKKLPPIQPVPNADTKSYPDFAGRYDYKNAVLTVTVEKDRLFSQLTGQDKFEIFPSAKDAFFWKVADAKIVFLRNEKGEVIAARHSQGGQSFKAERIVESAVKLTDAELDAITGKYQYGPAAVMTVTRDGTFVFAQLTGQPKFQIHPLSATEFEWRVVKASVKFIKDKDGNVTKATHSQNGATIDAPRLE